MTRKRKSKPSKRKAAARSKGRAAAFVFARSPPAKKPIRAIDQADSWKEWRRKRAEPETKDYTARRKNVRKILIARGTPSHVADEIAYGMEPDTFYILEVYGPPYDGAGLPGDVPIRAAVWVDTGVRLWSRVSGYTKGGGHIDDVTIGELARDAVGRPLWDQYSVKTVDGRRIYGHGNLKEWQGTLKIGRPKKGGGGMTAAERRKYDKNKADRLRRKRAIDQRIAALKLKAKQGDKSAALEADRLLERSKLHRKGDL